MLFSCFLFFFLFVYYFYDVVAGHGALSALIVELRFEH